MFQRAYIFGAVAALLMGGAVRGPAGRGGAGALDEATGKGNVSIQLPKGWVNAGGPALIAAQAPAADKDATGPYQASLIINNQGVGNKVDTAYGAAQQAILAKQMPGYREIEKPTSVVIGGLPGVMFGGSFKRGTVELRSRQYMLAANNQVYTITFTSLSSTWAAYQGVVEASVGTFGVKK